LKKKNYISDKEAKRIICQIGKRMYDRKYVAANDGNISVKVGDNAIWVTPTQVSKGFMNEEMLVKVDLEGNIIEGRYSATSEVKMHIRVYKENKNVTAVCHAHPIYATSFSIAGMALEKPILAEMIMQLGTVPVIEYTKPGTDELPDSIAEYCKDYSGVLLANHGVLTWGTDLLEAYHKMESIEHYSEILVTTENIIKKYNELTEEQINDLLEMKAKLEKEKLEKINNPNPKRDKKKKVDEKVEEVEDVYRDFVKKFYYNK